MPPNNPMTEGEALAVLRQIADEMRERKVNHGKHYSPTLVAWANRIDEQIAALAAHTAASGGEVVAWAVRWQQGPIKRATQVFTDAETAHGFYDWRKGSPCSEPVEFLQLVTAPPAAVPADALERLAASMESAWRPNCCCSDTAKSCADELAALIPKGDARGQG